MIDLPDANEPLPTARGLIPPRASLTKITEVPNNRDAVRIVMGTRRKISDMPVPPKAMNAIALICMYTMWGLNERDIAIATGLPEKQINAIRMSNEYAGVQQQVISTVLNTEDGDVKNYLKRHADTAARRMVELVDSPDEKIAVRAASDILNRNEIGPSTQAGKMDIGLRIEVIDRSADTGRPIIDVEVDDGNST